VEFQITPTRSEHTGARRSSSSRIQAHHASTHRSSLAACKVQGPVAYRLATLTYRTRQSDQPTYLYELFEDYQPLYSLRSASQSPLATVYSLYRPTARSASLPPLVYFGIPLPLVVGTQYHRTFVVVTLLILAYVN